MRSGYYRVTTINRKGKPFTHAFERTTGGAAAAAKLWRYLMQQDHIIVMLYLEGGVLCDTHISPMVVRKAEDNET